MNVEIADTVAKIEACYPVMRELRPHLRANAFVEVVRDMQREGYQLAGLLESNRVVAVAGFRIKRTLFCDRFLYVDDLVTLPAERSKGYGKALLEWLKDRARADGCAHLALDSGIQRKNAHRFYERNGLPIFGYHFSVELEARVPWANRQR